MAVTTEHLTRVTMRNNVALLAQTVVLQLVSAVALLVLSRISGSAGYAHYAVAMSVCTLAYACIIPMTRALVRARPTLPSLADSGAASVIMLCFVVVGAFAFAVSWFHAEASIPTIGAGIVYTVGLAATIPATATLQRQLRLARAGYLTLVDRISFPLTIIPALLLGFPMTSAIIVAFIASTVLNAAAAWIVGRQFWKPAGLRAALPVCQDAVPLVLMSVLSIAMFSLITPLVSLISGAHEAGLYAWSFSIIMAIQSILATIDASIMPAATHASRVQVTGALQPITRAVVFMAAVLSLLLLFAAPVLVGTIFPNRWEDALPALYTLVVATTVLAGTTSVNAVWNAHFNLRLQLRIYALSIVLGIVAVAALGPAWGALGAAIGYGVFTLTLFIGMQVAWYATTGHRITRAVPCLWMVIIGVVAIIEGQHVHQPLHLGTATAVTASGLAALLLVDRGRILVDLRSWVGLARGKH